MHPLVCWAVGYLPLLGITPTTSGDWAAWAQAVGSIAAVYAAFKVSSRQLDSATHLQRTAARAEQRRKYHALTGLVDAAIEEFTGILDALKGSDATSFFTENSAAELMDEFYQAFVQISPLEMPSASAVRALVKLRDLIKASAWSANQAIANVVHPADYEEYVNAVEMNLKEIGEEGRRLREELARA